MAKAPGRNDREGLTIKELFARFPTEEAAQLWFEKQLWPDGRFCPHCGSRYTTETKSGRHPMPYRCYDCNRYFSVRKGTILERSPIPLRDWAIAIYMHLTSLKGVSSMKLHRDLGVTQKTAWFMLQRIREAFKRDDDEDPMSGPVEVDEVYLGGLRKNMSNTKRAELAGASSAVGKEIVVGVKDRVTRLVRVRHVQHADTTSLSNFITGKVQAGATVYSDEAAVYFALRNWYRHESVNHSAGEYVRQQAHTNGIESFWSMLKRAHKGVYHKFSAKHLHRYIAEFAGRHNVRDAGTLRQMEGLAAAMRGKRLKYKWLIADNGLASGARAGKGATF